MCSKKRWGTALIEGLVKEKQEKEEKTEKKKKDGSWMDDPVEYAKRTENAKKHLSDPILKSGLEKDDLFWVEPLTDEEKEKNKKDALGNCE
jgi:hypothetical protein